MGKLMVYHREEQVTEALKANYTRASSNFLVQEKRIEWPLRDIYSCNDSILVM